MFVWFKLRLFNLACAFLIYIMSPFDWNWVSFNVLSVSSMSSMLRRDEQDMPLTLDVHFIDKTRACPLEENLLHKFGVYVSIVSHRHLRKKNWRTHCLQSILIIGSMFSFEFSRYLTIYIYIVFLTCLCKYKSRHGAHLWSGGRNSHPYRIMCFLSLWVCS